MTTTNNMNTNFKFRTKFKKLLNDENYSAITSAFEKFCSLDSVDAIEILWRMTYSKDKALEEVYKLGLDSKIISPENVLALRNELRYQYEQLVQPEFLQFYRDSGETIENAFLELKECTDGIVASIVYESCDLMLCISDEDIARTLGLLEHPKENYYFGGIRSMNFNMEEAEYLKPYHIEIHNLLEAMNNHIPFYTDEEEEECKKVEKIEEPVEEVAESENKNIPEEAEAAVAQFKPVIPEEILAHKELFKTFTESDDFNTLLPIGQLGFDLNEVMIRKEVIHNFIKAADALMK